MKKRLLFLALLLPAVLISASAQDELSTSSKKASKLYYEAIDNYRMMSCSVAIEKLEEAIDTDPGFLDAYFMLTQVLIEDRQSAEAVSWLEKGLSLDSTFYPYGYFVLGRLQYGQGEYRHAKDNFSRYLMLDKKDPGVVGEIRKELEKCEFAIRMVENPVPFSPINQGDNVNSEEDDYWPCLSADEQTLIITRLVEGGNVYGGKNEDFFISENSDSGWTKMKNAGYPLNSDNNEGAQSISADGRIMVYTACNRSDGVGRCDLYYSVKKGERWSYPENIGAPVNTKYKETQPSLSADGRTLYFASDRPGGSGKLDIWMSSQDLYGKWSVPVNLGRTINTPGDEMSPFIHHDNQTLYFASDYHMGMGGFDLFISSRDSSGNWGKPQNLGYPINTHRDEFGLVVTANGKKAYYASDINEEKGKDIFSFELYEEVQPIEVSYMKGKVYDADTRKNLGARFELIDLETETINTRSDSDPVSGEFLICIPANRDYLLNVSKEEYIFYSDHFALKTSHKKSEPFLKDIPLHPIRTGKSIILRNIFYETDSYTLKDESKPELNKLVNFLQSNPEVNIEIHGHTDNVGSEDYNQKLSENRALSVVEYLTKHEINVQRISHKGFGYSQPVASNDTEEGRARNRRTEMMIK